MVITDAPHDSLVIEAASRLTVSDRYRHLAELRQFLAVPGSHSRIGSSAAVEFLLEAALRRDRGDPTWVMWAAWAESLALTERVQALCH